MKRMRDSCGLQTSVKLFDFGLCVAGEWDATSWRFICISQADGRREREREREREKERWRLFYECINRQCDTVLIGSSAPQTDQD